MNSKEQLEALKKVAEAANSFGVAINELLACSSKSEPDKKNLLVKFLKEQGVYEEFKANYESILTHSRSHEDYLNFYNKSMGAIGNAFVWFETAQGIIFWQNIDYKWQDYLKEATQ